jgi:hypothetical protein
MAVALTQAQKDAIKAAVTAFRQAANQAENARLNYAAKQDALVTANEAVRAAALVVPDANGGPPAILDTFRIGAKVFSWVRGWLVEVDDITDLS